MPYTYSSLAFMWLITLGLFAVSASGLVAGSSLILLLLVALATPALILRRFEHSAAVAAQLDAVRVTAGSRRRPSALAKTIDRSRLKPVAIDVDLWEDDGAAP